MNRQSTTVIWYKSNIVIVILLIVLALVMRLYGPAQWDLIYDEYFTFFHAEERYNNWINPAYYALVTASFKLFGFSEWAARFPALLLGVISIPVFYITWQKIIGRNAALFGALLIIFSTWHIWYSQFSRFYSGVFLFGSLAYYLYFKAVRYNEISALLWFLLVVITGFLFHATFIFAIPSFILFSLFILYSESAKNTGYSRRIASIFLVGSGFLGVIALIILLPSLWEMAGGWYLANQFWGYSPLGTLLQLTKWMQIPIVVSSIIGLAFLLHQDYFKGMYFTIGVVSPIVFLIAGSTITTVRPEYIFYCIPLVFCLSGYLCEQTRLAISGMITNRHNHTGSIKGLNSIFFERWILQPAVAIIVLSGLLPELVSHYTGRMTLDLRDTASVVKSVYRPGDRILPLINLHNFFDHYSDIPYEPEPVIGDPLDDSIEWKHLMRRFEYEQQCVWIILPIRRQALARELETWVLGNASLVWRQSSKRFDYKIEGYQLFVSGKQQEICRKHAISSLSQN
jgi:hypothetical protein